MEQAMRAIVRETYGGPEQLIVKEVPVPEPKEGEVRIAVKAFGINRAETYMRRGAWGDVSNISGIECVGVVSEDPAGRFRAGQTVAAIMGGMGRTRAGSYAEFTCAPASNVFALETSLPWAELAAVPESFATAWWCLFKNLRIEAGHSVLIRGATSALGQAAINIAADFGAAVLGTTRNVDSKHTLHALGAAHVLQETQALSNTVRELYAGGIDRVLDLVGNSTLRDSLRALKPGGKVCQAGFLGGPDPVEGFNPILDLPSDVDLSFFGSFVLGADGFPTSKIPMQQIVQRVENGRYKAKPARVFPFEAVPDAHRLMESNGANGKIVVEV
jgi:NADPH2:quinone reductase